MAANQLFDNNTTSTVGVQLLTGGTTLTIANSAHMPEISGSQFYYLTLVRNSDDAIEIVRVTGKSILDLTIVRSQEGTTALQFEIGDVIEARLTAKVLDELSDGTGIGHSNGGVGIGPGSAASTNAVAVGTSSNTASNAIAIGYVADAGGDSSISIGIGSQTIADDVIQMQGVHSFKAEEVGDGLSLVSDLSGTVAVMQSNTLDMTASTNTITFNLPDAEFYPIEVGIFYTDVDTCTVGPTFKVGRGLALEKWLASTVATAPSAKGIAIYDTLASVESEPGLGSVIIDFTTVATATTLEGRFYVKGYFIQNPQGA